MAASHTPGSPARRSRWYSILLALSFLALLSANTVEAKTHKAKQLSYSQKKHSTANADQSASLQAGAVKLSAGQYTFTNVATGKSLHYTADGNNVVPAKGSGTQVALKHHPNKKTRWLQISLQGGKKKCLSSQWGGSGDNAAVAYQCNNSGLEKTKQWWIFVPSGKTNTHASSTSTANNLLLAQQAESDKLHRRDEYEDEEAVDDDAWVEEFEEVEEDDEDDVEEELSRLVKRKKHHKKSKKSKKSKKTKKVSKGKTDGKHYFIIPTDHLMDTKAVALTAGGVKTGNAMSTKLKTMKTSNKAQLWKIYKH